MLFSHGFFLKKFSALRIFFAIEILERQKMTKSVARKSIRRAIYWEGDASGERCLRGGRPLRLGT